MASMPVPGELYRHHDGALYRIVGGAAGTEPNEPIVLYRPLDPRADQTVRALALSRFDAPPARGHGAAARFQRIHRPGAAALESFLPQTLIPHALRQAVLARHDEPHRFYHDRSHVLALFECAQRKACTLSTEQALALLYHDAVYVPGAPAGHNEGLSALLMRAHAWQLSPDLDIARVATIIEDTARHEPTRPESALVLDLDLSPLAAAPIQFLALDEMVWLENRHFFDRQAEPRRAFDERRARFLEALAARERLFHVLGELEAPARANIEALRSRHEARKSSRD